VEGDETDENSTDAATKDLRMREAVAKALVELLKKPPTSEPTSKTKTPAKTVTPSSPSVKKAVTEKSAQSTCQSSTVDQSSIIGQVEEKKSPVQLETIAMAKSNVFDQPKSARGVKKATNDKDLMTMAMANSNVFDKVTTPDGEKKMQETKYLMTLAMADSMVFDEGKDRGNKQVQDAKVPPNVPPTTPVKKQNTTAPKMSPLDTLFMVKSHVFDKKKEMIGSKSDSDSEGSEKKRESARKPSNKIGKWQCTPRRLTY